MQFSEQWLRSYADPPYSSDELAERLTMAGLEVESDDPVAPAVFRCRRGRSHARSSASERRQADGVRGRGRRGRDSFNRLRRIERGAGNQGAVRVGGRDTSRRGRDQRGHVTRCAVARHVVFRARAWTVRRSRRPADPRRGRTARHRFARLPCARRSQADDQADARPRGLFERGRCGARSGCARGVSADARGDRPCAAGDR